MRRELMVSAAALALAAGCQDRGDGDEALARAQARLVAPAPVGPVEVPAPTVDPPSSPAVVPEGGATDPGEAAKDPAAKPDPHADGPPPHYRHELYSKFPWGQAEGGVWKGTGAPDPEPLRGISDEEMLRRTRLEGTPDDRLNALVSVGRRKMPGALEALSAALVPDEAPIVRELALSGLVEHGGLDALQVMWKQGMTDPSPHIRGNTIWAIALYGGEQAKKAIQAGFTDDDPSVRGMAILATTALGNDPARWTWLEQALRSDEQLVFQEAAYVLSNTPDRRAGKLLGAELFKAGDDAKRRTLAHAYRQFRRAFPDLL